MRPQPKHKSALDRLADAYRKKRGLRLTAQQVQALVLSDNALESLIDEWSKVERTMNKRYCFNVADGDELQACAMSVAAAEQAAREYAKEVCDGPTEFRIYDARPATPLDAELWENSAEDEETAEITKQPNWWADKWVPENVVHTFIYDPALKAEAAT